MSNFSSESYWGRTKRRAKMNHRQRAHEDLFIDPEYVKAVTERSRREKYEDPRGLGRKGPEMSEDDMWEATRQEFWFTINTTWFKVAFGGLAVFFGASIYFRDHFEEDFYNYEAQRMQRERAISEGGLKAAAFDDSWPITKWLIKANFSIFGSQTRLALHETPAEERLRLKYADMSLAEIAERKRAKEVVSTSSVEECDWD